MKVRPQRKSGTARRAIADIDAGLGRRAAKARRDDRQCAAESNRDEERQEAEFERRRQAAENDPHDILAQRDRGAEVALEGLAEPDPELRQDRLVEAVKRA